MTVGPREALPGASGSWWREPDTSTNAIWNPAAGS